MKLVEQWLGSGLPDLSPMFCRVAADLALDAVQCADSIKRLGCDRRRIRCGLSGFQIVSSEAKKRQIHSFMAHRRLSGSGVS